MNTKDLVRAAKRGDDQAFYQLVVAHSEVLFRIALSYFKNEEDALEAVQETTCRAYTKLNHLRKSQYFGTWIVRILINYCLNELKHRQRQAPIVRELEVVDADVDPIRLVIESALDKLEPKFKEIIILNITKIGQSVKLLKRSAARIAPLKRGCTKR